MTKYKARGVSLPADMWGDAEKRVAKLHPWVSNFSAYVQRLIKLDLERTLLDGDGGINHSVVGKGKPPSFSVAQDAFCTTVSA